MTYIVQFAQGEQLTLDDLNNIGVASKATFDALITDAIDSSLKFAQFPMTAISATSVNVAAGRLYKGGLMYSNEDGGGVAIPLINYLPSAAGNTKIVSIIAFGTEAASATTARSFLTNSQTGAVEGNNVSTTIERRANLSASPGQEGPNPQPPPVSSDQCEIARIVMNTTGIASITYVETNRLTTNTGLDARTNSLEGWRVTTGARIDTLATDISTLASSIVGLPSPAIFSQIVHTLAQVQTAAKIPASALNFHLDNFLTEADSASDTTNGAYLCRVQEGIRFQWAAQASAPLTTFNSIEPKIKAGSNAGMMLPDYSEVARINTVGNDGTLPLSQYQYQTLTAYQQNVSRQVLNFGTSFTVCVNNVWWQEGTYDPISGIFSINGQQYTVTDTGVTTSPGLSTAHEVLRLQQFWTSTMTDTYTAYNSNTFTVSGATLSQTFLNSQAGWLTSFEVAFGTVATSGDVTLLLCATVNGVPDFTKVVSRSTVVAANLLPYPATTKFPITPMYCDAGVRYAAVLVTSGNHTICYTNNNKYAQGSMFISTDGSFTQGDLLKDIGFIANFAKFTGTICQVSMTPLQLANGITDISLIYGTKIPAGCSLFWEVQVNTVWYPMASYGTGSNPLLGLPPLLPLRVTFLGTTDLMPGIDMTQTQSLVARPRGDFTHITPTITIGVASSSIRVLVTVDAFDPAVHTVLGKLNIAGSDVTPTATTTAIDPTDTTRRTMTYTFALGSPTTTFKVKISGTASSTTDVYHVESRYDYES